MHAELSTGKHSKRHPYDWYVEEQWVTEQLINELADFRYEAFNGLAIWDPCAGYGNVGAAFENARHEFNIHLSDIVENVDYSQFSRRPSFASADFLALDRAPAPCSIVFNPPFSYRKGILEACVRKALKLTSSRVCALVPNKWLASQSRYQLFRKDHPPAKVLHLTQRPSMPPGDMIAAMGARAFRGGMIDYCWIEWDVINPTKPGETRTVWLPPLGEQS